MTTSCPYCNAVVAVPSPLPGDRRIPCPRCGERFAYAGPEPEFAPLAHAAVSPPPAKKPNRYALRFVAATMLLACVGVVVWNSYGEKPADSRPLGARPWASLGFVPADANAILAVRPGDAPESFRLKEQLARIPAGTRVGLEAIVGPLDELAELTVGLRIDEAALPKLTLVAISAKSFDVERLAKSAKSSEDREGRTFYAVQPPGLPVELVAWRARPDVLIASLNADELARVAAEPAEGLSHLQPKMRTIIDERLPPERFAFAVADTEGWEKWLAPRLIAGRLAPDADLAKLKAVAAFAGGERIEVGVRLADAEAIEKLRAAWKVPIDVDGEWASWGTNLRAP